MGKSPCGPDNPHLLCRQFGYCLFGNTLPKPYHHIDGIDNVNAKLMAASTWAFAIFFIIAASIYDEKKLNLPYGTKYEDFNEYLAYALIINAILCAFPTGWNFMISNVFEAKVFANSIWNIVLGLGALALLNGDLKGVSTMQFALGWSISMFITTGAREKKILCYPAALLFLIFAVIISMTKERNDNEYFNYSVQIASFMFGFMVWSALEGYPHVNNFGYYPDSRTDGWKEKILHYSNPHKRVSPKGLEFLL